MLYIKDWKCYEQMKGEKRKLDNTIEFSLISLGIHAKIPQPQREEVHVWKHRSFSFRWMVLPSPWKPTSAQKSNYLYNFINRMKLLYTSTQFQDSLIQRFPTRKENICSWKKEEEKGSNLCQDFIILLSNPNHWKYYHLFSSAWNLLLYSIPFKSFLDK